MGKLEGYGKLYYPDGSQFHGRIHKGQLKAGLFIFAN